MKKRILSTLLALAMVLAMLPTVALAAPVTGPGNNITSIAELNTALGGGHTESGTELTLTNDVALTGSLMITSGTYTIKGDGAGKNTITAASGGTLSSGMLRINGGAVTLEGVTIDADGGDFSAAYINDTVASLTVGNGAKLTGVSSTMNTTAGVSVNLGTLNLLPGGVITGNEITVGGNTAKHDVYTNSYFNMSGGTVHSVQVVQGTMNVTGGAIGAAAGAASLKVSGNPLVKITGGSIYDKVAISGGNLILDSAGVGLLELSASGSAGVSILKGTVTKLIIGGSAGVFAKTGSNTTPNSNAVISYLELGADGTGTKALNLLDGSDVPVGSGNVTVKVSFSAGVTPAVGSTLLRSGVGTPPLGGGTVTGTTTITAAYSSNLSLPSGYTAALDTSDSKSVKLTAIPASPTVYVRNGTAVSGSAAGSDAANGSYATPFATLGAAYAAVADEGEIRVLSDLEAASTTTFAAAKEVTVTSYEDETTAKTGDAWVMSTTAGGVLSITAGEVTLEKITLDAGGRIAADVADDVPGKGRAITVSGAGTVLNITAGTTVMGGSAGDSTGGGLNIGADSTVNMSGGTLSHSRARHGAAVQVAANAKFNFSGGIITANRARYADGRAGSGSAILSYGETNITGGTISGNTGGTAISIENNSQSNITGGIISNNAGRGVAMLLGATITMGSSANPIIITDNSAGNVLLSIGQAIVLTGTLHADSDIGVYTEDVPTDTTDVTIVEGDFDATTNSSGYKPQASDAVFFRSDNAATAGVGFFENTTGEASAANYVNLLKLSIGNRTFNGDQYIYVRADDDNSAAGTSAAGDDGADGSYATPVATLGEAYKRIAFGTGAREIRVLSDLEATARTNFNANKTVTVLSYEDETNEAANAWTVTASAFTGSMNVVSDGTVVLENIIFDGNKRSDTAGSNIFTVSTLGELIINDGTTLTGGQVRYYPGGAAVHVQGGKVTMNGGLITDNHLITNANLGGAVSVGRTGAYAGAFVMNGGEISGNSALGGGGGLAVFSGTATISGAPRIINNTKGVSELSNVYLADGQTLLIDGALTAGANIGVFTEIMPNATTDVTIAVGTFDASTNPGGYQPQAGDTVFFRSDNASTAGVGYFENTTNVPDWDHDNDSTTAPVPDTANFVNELRLSIGNRVANGEDIYIYVRAAGATDNSGSGGSAPGDDTAIGSYAAPVATLGIAYKLLPLGTGIREIRVLSDLDVTAQIPFNAAKNATVISWASDDSGAATAAWTAKRNASFTGGTMLLVTAGTVTLENIEFDGNGVNVSPAGRHSSGATVSGADTTLTINEGTVFKNHVSNSLAYSAYSGAGVSVMNGAHVEMNGGAVRNNRANYSSSTTNGATRGTNVQAGGLYLFGGSFTMNGGEITGNIGRGGGIIGGDVTINGGTITHNVGVNIDDARYGGGISNTTSLTIGNSGNPIIITDNVMKRVVNIDATGNNTVVQEEIINNVKLDTGKTITMTAAPETGSIIGVFCVVIPNADGEFTVIAVGDGTYEPVPADAEFFTSDKLTQAGIKYNGSDKTILLDYDARLMDLKLTGYVVEHGTTTGVNGATVKIAVNTGGGAKTLTAVTKTGGPENKPGYFEIIGKQVVRGDYILYVNGGEKGNAIEEFFLSKPAYDLGEIELDGDQASIFGGVLTAHGESVEDVTVAIRDKETGALIPIGTAPYDDVVITPTSEAGGYVVTGLPEGTYIIETTGTYTLQPGPGTAVVSGQTEVTVDGDGKVAPNTAGGYTNLNIGESEGHIVSGKIDGLEPGETAKVSVTVPVYDEAGNVIGSKVVTAVAEGPDGYYQIPGVPNGNYTLTVTDGDGNATQIPNVTVSGGNATGKNGAVEANPNDGKTALTGIALDQDGKPLVGAAVTIYDSEGNVVGTTTTGAGGGYSYLLDGDTEDGLYYISVDQVTTTGISPVTYHPHNGLGGPVELKGGEVVKGKTNVTVDMSGDSKLLTGTVEDSDGEPVAGAQVVVKDAAGNVIATAATNDDGTYFIGGVPAGSTVTVVTPDGEVSTKNVPGSLTNTVSENDAKTRINGDTQTAAPDANKLKVIGPDGTPLPLTTTGSPATSATVTLKDSGGNPVAPGASTYSVNAQGEITVDDDLPNGTYTVTIEKDGMSVTKTITVRDGEITNGNLFEIGAKTVSGSLQTATGTIPGDATVTISAPGGAPSWGSSDINAQGEWSIPGIPEGTYEMEIVIKDDAGGDVTITVPVTVDRNGKATYDIPGATADSGTGSSVTVNSAGKITVTPPTRGDVFDVIDALTDAKNSTNTGSTLIDELKDALEGYKALSDEQKKQVDSALVKAVNDRLSAALAEQDETTTIETAVDIQVTGVANPDAIKDALANQRGLLLDEKDWESIEDAAIQSVSVSLTLVAEDVTDDPNPGDLAKIQALASKAEAIIDSLFDIYITKTTLTNTTGDPQDNVVDSDGRVAEVPQMISITLNIPAALRGYEFFGIVRVHSNKAEYIPSTVRFSSSGSAQTITFETNKFSTYALVYSNDPIFDGNVNIKASGGGGIVSPGTGNTASVNSGKGGTVTIKPTAPKAGDKVTITVTPDEGYVLERLTITDANGNPVAFTDNGDGTFTYTQPEGGVTISATFRPFINPDKTGVAEWLNTVDHMVYLIGDDRGIFRPADNMTRAEVAVMFYRLLNNKSIDTSKAAFDDVESGTWYTEAVHALAALGIITGYEDGTFRPNASISRAEFVTIASRFTKAIDSGDVSFLDVEAGHWAYEAILTAAAYEWIDGYTDGTFRPSGNITRAEVTKIVNRMLGRYPDDSYIDAAEDLKYFPDVAKNYWAFYEIVEATNEHEYEHANGKEIWK